MEIINISVLGVIRIPYLVGPSVEKKKETPRKSSEKTETNQSMGKRIGWVWVCRPPKGDDGESLLLCVMTDIIVTRH